MMRAHAYGRRARSDDLPRQQLGDATQGLSLGAGSGDARA